MPALDVNRLKGNIVVETGPMNTSKTEEEIRQGQKIDGHTDFRCLAVTNNVNTRDGDGYIVSNGGSLRYPAHRIDVTRPEMLLDILEQEDERKFVDVVMIDEGNFYNHRLIPVLLQLKRDMRVAVVAGLDLNFRGDPFKPMNRVTEIADVVNHHHAYCQIRKDGKKCGNLARYTARVRRDSTHKIQFYDKDGKLLKDFGFAPYFDLTILPESASGESDVKYTVACEGCFRIPMKAEVIAFEHALLQGEMPVGIPGSDKILEFLLHPFEKRWIREGESIVPYPHRYDTESGMYVPIEQE